MGEAWFGPKRLGYGVSPRTWQGWALTALLALVLVGARRITTMIFGHTAMANYATWGIILLALSIYLVIASKKYDSRVDQ
jgi:hypothetical protein